MAPFYFVAVYFAAVILRCLFCGRMFWLMPTGADPGIRFTGAQSCERSVGRRERRCYSVAYGATTPIFRVQYGRFGPDFSDGRLDHRRALLLPLAVARRPSPTTTSPCWRPGRPTIRRQPVGIFIQAFGLIRWRAIDRIDLVGSPSARMTVHDIADLARRALAARSSSTGASSRLSLADAPALAHEPQQYGAGEPGAVRSAAPCDPSDVPQDVALLSKLSPDSQVGVCVRAQAVGHATASRAVRMCAGTCRKKCLRVPSGSGVALMTSTAAQASNGSHCLTPKDSRLVLGGTIGATERH